MDVHVRWMIRRDFAEVLEIEAAGFEFPWLEDDFVLCLRQRSCIGMVAEERVVEPTDGSVGRIAGFMVYDVSESHLHVLNFAVADWCRRQGVGRAMVSTLLRKLSPKRRTRITLEIRERNVAAQLFFRACGFRAVAVWVNYYEETDEDAYYFVRLREWGGIERGGKVRLAR